MVGQLLDLLYGIIKASNQSKGQPDLVRQASHAIATFRGHYHNISSFSGSAQEVVVLRVLDLVILVMMQCGQSFSCGISHSSFEGPPRGRSLDHLADMVDMISHRLLVYDHLYMP
jgi:hypothetical protein